MNNSVKKLSSPADYFEEFCEIAKHKNAEVLSEKEEYINAHTPLRVRCGKCTKEFKADLSHWKFGEGKRGCPYCVGKHKDMNSILDFCESVGWSCSNTEYRGINGRYQFTCPSGEHTYEKTFRTFKRAHNCGHCIEGLTLADFENLASSKKLKILSDKNRVKFNVFSLVAWECSKGHRFKARFTTVSSSGCPNCT